MMETSPPSRHRLPPPELSILEALKGIPTRPEDEDDESNAVDTIS
jgi:hypothetical protein